MDGGGGQNSGAVQAIKRFGDLCLRRKSLSVKPDDPAVVQCLADLWQTLDDDGGVGLAAPQIGRNMRVAVIRNPKGKAGQDRFDLINPRITSTFGPVVGFEEGCLSFPGLYTTVNRPKGISLEYQDTTGQTLSLKDDGLLARIIQHEVEHLDGILFIDRLPRLKRWLLIPRLGMMRLGFF